MPEGFNSIDDMKVVISTETEPLAKGLSDAKKMITEFGESGAAGAKAADNSFVSLGQSIVNLRASFGPWLAMVETGLGLLQNWSKVAESWAKTAGLSNEFMQIKKSVEDLGNSVTRSFKVPFEDAEKAANGSGDAAELAGKRIGESMAAASRARKKANDEERVSAEEIAEAVKTYGDLATTTAYEVKGAATQLEWMVTVSRQIGQDVPASTNALEQFAEAAARVQAKALNYDWGLKQANGFAEGIAQRMREAASILELLIAIPQKSDAALEGEMRLQLREFQEWQAQLQKLRAGGGPDFSAWLFGRDENTILAKLQAVKDKLDELKAERDKREVPTEGFEEEMKRLERELELLEQKGELIGLAADEADRLLQKQKSLNNLAVDDEDLNKAERKRLEAALDERQAQFKENMAKQASADVDKAIKDLEAEAAAIENKTKLLGLEGAEAARAAAEYRVLTAARQKDHELTDEQTDALQEQIAAIEKATSAQKAREGALANVKALDDLDRQVESLRLQVVAFDMSAGAAARLRGQQAMLNAEIKNGVSFTDEQRDRMAEQLAAIEDLENARSFRQKDKQFDRDLVSADREIDALQKKILAYGMEADALAVVTMEEKLLRAARQHGIELDDERLDRIQDMAIRYGDLTRQAKDMERSMTQLRDAGNIAARSLESAFDKWIKGTKISFQELVADMLRQLALLTLRASVLQPLFGGGSSGNGAIGNMLAGLLNSGGASAGGWSTSVIPAFADGGRFEAGVPMIVGERRPEMLIPDVSGRIAPGVGSDSLNRPAPTINMPIYIDARGATQDAIPALRQEVAEIKASLPGTIVQTMADARDRGNW